MRPGQTAGRAQGAQDGTGQPEHKAEGTAALLMPALAMSFRDKHCGAHLCEGLLEGLSRRTRHQVCSLEESLWLSSENGLKVCGDLVPCPLGSGNHPDTGLLPSVVPAWTQPGGGSDAEAQDTPPPLLALFPTASPWPAPRPPPHAATQQLAIKGPLHREVPAFPDPGSVPFVHPDQGFTWETFL